MTRLHDWPPWFIALAALVVFVGASFVGLSVSRRWSRESGVHALVDNTVIGWIFSAILGVYAIAIGLIAIESWGNASKAANVASHEAAEIAVLYRGLGGYPPPVQRPMRDILTR